MTKSLDLDGHVIPELLMIVTGGVADITRLDTNRLHPPSSRSAHRKNQRSPTGLKVVDQRRKLALLCGRQITVGFVIADLMGMERKDVPQDGLVPNIQVT
jgi:hypothetical protein